MRPLRPAALLALALLAACGDDVELVPADSAQPALPDTPVAPGYTGSPADTGASAAAGADPVVTATLRDASGRELGVLTLAQTAEGIAVAGTLRGVAPGEHALHLHTVGACTPDFAAAGGHWNPTDRRHGRLHPAGPHLGDLPNVTVGADSTVIVAVTSPGGALRPEQGANPLLDADGAAVVLHAGADDYRSDPAGNAGDRVACGELRGV